MASGASGSLSWAISQARDTCKTCCHSIWTSSLGRPQACDTLCTLSIPAWPPCLLVSVMPQGSQLLCLVLGKQGIRQFVQVAIHNMPQLVQRKVDAVIGDTALRVVISTYALGTITRTHQALALSRFFKIGRAHV